MIPIPREYIYLVVCVVEVQFIPFFRKDKVSSEFFRATESRKSGRVSLGKELNHQLFFCLHLLHPIVSCQLPALSCTSIIFYSPFLSCILSLSHFELFCVTDSSISTFTMMLRSVRIGGSSGLAAVRPNTTPRVLNPSSSFSYASYSTASTGRSFTVTNHSIYNKSKTSLSSTSSSTSNNLSKASIQTRFFHATANTMADTRAETDAFGEVHVPADKYWGAQTERSL